MSEKNTKYTGASPPAAASNLIPGVGKAFNDPLAAADPAYHLYFISGGNIVVPTDAVTDLKLRLVADGQRTGTPVTLNGVRIA